MTEIKLTINEALDAVAAIEYRIAQVTINIQNVVSPELKQNYKIEKSNLESVRDKILKQINHE